jgi:hypothetical protein
MELKPDSTKKAKAVLVVLSPRNEDGSVPITERESEENLPWGLYRLKYFDEKSILKGYWIRCQHCKTWLLEVCVDAKTVYLWIMYVNVRKKGPHSAFSEQSNPEFIFQLYVL